MGGHHEAQRVGAVAILPAPVETWSAADQSERVLEVIDHLNGGRRIVDSRRQRPDRDIDENPEREGRVLVDRPLDPERDSARQPPLRHPLERCHAVHLEQNRTGGNEVADSVRHHENRIVVGSPREQALVVDRLDRARPRAVHDERRLSGTDPGELGALARAAASARELHRADEGRPACPRDELGHLDGSEPVHEAVEEDQEEDEPCTEQQARHRDAEIGNGVVDTAQEGIGECKRPHQNRECGFEDAVAVPQAHVAGRERPRRHLDDEDADRDDESEEADARADDGREDRQRRVRRIPPPVGNCTEALHPDTAEAEQNTEQAADQRQHPETPFQGLPHAKSEAPAHVAEAYGRRRLASNRDGDRNGTGRGPAHERLSRSNALRKDTR